MSDPLDGGGLVTRPRVPVPMPAPGESVEAMMMYQSENVPTSLLATGKVGSRRDESGDTNNSYGLEVVPKKVKVTNGRGREFTLDDHGFSLVQDKRQHIDYFNEEEILHNYYPACCEIVKRATGATKVVAFDHNLRSRNLKGADAKLSGGNAVQGPAFLVHNDYTVTSAPKRVRDLASPPKVNDTLRKVLGDTPAIDPAEVDRLVAGRWAIINVWRNVKDVPIQCVPLALCDGPSVPLKDYVVFEINYADRVGENYFARHSEGHRWYYFPQLTRDEALVLKCWDSAGVDFAPTGSSQPSVRATFSLHTAFEDPSSPAEALDRESLEVRTIAFFPDAATQSQPSSRL
eukprot:gnl/TRDRNA2_/TRDRNA2_193235_c0_seq1.p1 gnl/TRDRNA2_/TRDRNA2_193235_c0~~gnl/TRDRNA2_/TRDRNA2_193235_c0_seq1.p1  ORF type:complete len:358 (+),score=62.79 gnl/TRDRNA2_/TRDRNA2_193235_c0_seq1:39-1076(+)